MSKAKTAEPEASSTGWLLYARVLRAVIDGECHALAASAATGVGLNNIRLILRSMHQQGLIHIGAWKGVGVKNVPVKCYAFGPGVDAPPPVSTRSGLPSKHGAKKPFRPRSEMIAFASILAQLRAEPCSTLTLAERCGVSRRFQYRFLRQLRALNSAYIADHEESTQSRRPTALWSFGIGKADVKRKSRRLTRPEYARIRKEKLDARGRMLSIVHALAGSASASRFPIAA